MKITHVFIALMSIVLPSVAEHRKLKTSQTKWVIPLVEETPAGRMLTTSRQASGVIGIVTVEWSCVLKTLCASVTLDGNYAINPSAVSFLRISNEANTVEYAYEEITSLPLQNKCHESNDFEDTTIYLEVTVFFCLNGVCGRRATGTQLVTEVPCEGGGDTDPHFMTWDGTPYSYHGACDMVLAQSPTFADGLGLDVHIRTGIQSRYSRITNGAVKIGEDILEVLLDGSHYFNGMHGELADTPSEISGFELKTAGKCHKRDPSNKAECLKMYSEYRIILDEQEYIKISSFAGFVNVYVKSPLVDFAGLIGTHGKTGMIDRSGNPLTDPIAMGTEWQVRDTEPMIFHNIEGPQFPKPCNLPKENAHLSWLHTKKFQEKVSSADGRRSLRGYNQEDPLFDEALTACEGAINFQGCLTDVLATRDVDVALLYVDADI